MHMAMTMRWNPKAAAHPLRTVELLNCAPSKLPENKQHMEYYPTYGAHLLDEQYKHRPFRLRHLVARCLCEVPADRPSFEYIRAELEWAWNNDTDDEPENVRQWSMAQFEKPPAPVPPPWKRVEEVSLYIT